MKSSPRGIALLIVLWVLTILMVTGVSFSLMTRAETFGTLAFKEDVEQKYLAEAGIERGIMEILYRFVHRDQTVTLERENAWSPDGTPHTVALGEGACRITIIDESGKIALNSLTDASVIVLKNVLLRQQVTPEQADAICDAILDWKDADDLHRLHGAESEYYLSLPKPYKAANAPFAALEELGFVRGVTPEILYGTGGKKGLIACLTLYHTTGKINVNVASKELLAALPGMDAMAVETLIEARSRAVPLTWKDLKESIGIDDALMAPYIEFKTADAATFFTIEATGYRGSPGKGYSISATVHFERPLQYRYLRYKSPAGDA